MIFLGMGTPEHAETSLLEGSILLSLKTSNFFQVSVLHPIISLLTNKHSFRKFTFATG